jgi:hypothetical protein
MVAGFISERWPASRRNTRPASIGICIEPHFPRVYIPPECAEDWFFQGYCNSASGSYIGFTARKLRSYPPFASPTTLRRSIENDALQQKAHSLLSAISYSGIMDLDYRSD